MCEPTHRFWPIAAVVLCGSAAVAGEPVDRPVVGLTIWGPTHLRPREFVRPHADRLRRAGYNVRISVQDVPDPTDPVSVLGETRGVYFAQEEFDLPDPRANAKAGRWFAWVEQAMVLLRPLRPPVEAPRPPSTAPRPEGPT